ncbi:hypothetical protein PENANT_c022G11433 [Penicillium antarcticum]|uniref:Major facilitator superfamily (MFS) profile domain-containing protein n=1 Tax=Penicillium antarcticum TaxID=416450 RepID=A0A1V6PYY4_9EURO|nr:uncharacterized protein N7508_002841 [Penicillium antarcticum]KAJ5312011.1 hypothetical protein N7508_002841 [Penicillium antarcticum]OQD82234.1 hypothetical protein PENANT_c022G11433 [Penicillium antarcticum]
MTTSTHETEPLLSADPTISPTRKSKKVLILIVCAVFLLSAEFGFFMSTAPQTAVFEDIICRNYQAGLHGTENATQPDLNPCKSEAVQGELAIVIGYKDTFDTIPSIVLSLPYGILSDHWGRRPVLYLSMLGIILSEFWIRMVCLWSTVFPLRMVWLSSVFRIIGGGDSVLTAIALVIVADVFSEDERSTALFRLQSCVLLAEILATPLSAYMMSFGPMFPYLVSICLILVGCIPALFLPETLEDAKAKPSLQTHSEEHDENGQPERMGNKSFLEEVKRQAREFKVSTRFIWTDSNVCIMILVFFVTIMTRQSTNLLLQYVSKKFDWSIARSSLLISLRGIFSMVTFMVFMPALSFLTAKYFNLHGKQSDHVMSKGSGILSVIGFAAIALAPTPAILIFGQIILSMGMAFMVNTRSLATALVLPDHVGTLYSALAITQSAGMLVAGPLFANLFRLGMHLGNAWLGLPFLQASLFFVIAVVAVWHIRLGPSRVSDEEQESSAE